MFINQLPENTRAAVVTMFDSSIEKLAELAETVMDLIPQPDHYRGREATPHAWLNHARASETPPKTARNHSSERRQELTLAELKTTLNAHKELFKQLTASMEYVNKKLTEAEVDRARLSERIATLSHSRNGGRGRSRSRGSPSRPPSNNAASNNQSTCSFHRRYGPTAFRCLLPCDKAHLLQQNNSNQTNPQEN